MAKGVKFKQIDKGWLAYARRALQLSKDKPRVKVGILASAGDHMDKPMMGPHLEKDQKKAADRQEHAMTVAQVGAIHEFGDEDRGIPERSYIRTTMDESREELLTFKSEMREKFLLGEMSLEQAMGLIGEKAQSKIQAKIRNGDSSWEPLKPGTIKRKGSSRPLIDSGQLLNSIKWQRLLKGR